MCVLIFVEAKAVKLQEFRFSGRGITVASRRLKPAFECKVELR